MKQAPDSSKKLMDCKDIQPLLLGYMNRELGAGRSDLVRKHLRKCDKCQAEAADMKATIALLRESSDSDSGIPRHLSDEHRKRIAWSIAHPILDWIYAHHILVSVIVALLALIAIGAWSCREKTRPIETVYPVYIGRPVITNGRLHRIQGPLPAPENE